MQFEKDHIFHIYNQGNNRQDIFFNRDNYLFFLKKIRKYVLPYADILAWCLMPNHFHLMVLVNEVERQVATDPMTSSHRISKKITLNNSIAIIRSFNDKENPEGRQKPSASLEATPTMETRFSKRITPSEIDGSKLKMRTFNDSIGIMLRSYTNAINKRYKRSGKLFREETKAECLTDLNGVTPAFYNTSSGALINTDGQAENYLQRCFDYIHYNPVKAGMVEMETDWEFSSARDYAGLRDGKLVNKELAKQYVHYSSDDSKSSDE